MWTGTWEICLVKTGILLEKGNSWHLIMNVIFSIRFRGVSQALQTTDITAFQTTANLSLISKSALYELRKFGSKFHSPHNHSETTCFIMHVDLATHATEILMTLFFSELTKGYCKSLSCELYKLTFELGILLYYANVNGKHFSFQNCFIVVTMFSYNCYWSTPIDVYHATRTVSPQLPNHHVRPVPQCSKRTLMTVATLFPSTHYVSVCSSSFSKLR